MMRDQIRWDILEGNVLMMGEAIQSDNSLRDLYQEAQEYDFLTDKTPKALPDYWEEED
jgi:hypothetical protein